MAKLIGFGCDGANVNIAAGGLRGLLEEPMPWIVVVWCLAHRLELALKDALKKTLFTDIDDMLLRLYYLYEKSPKKCNELKEVVENLRMCLEESEMSNKYGIRPIRACGTRFVAHKVSAINRLIERHGAYLSHLTEDPTVKAIDKQKIKGYIRKWRDCKMLLGCALFHDLLKPAAVLCKVLQNDEICVLSAIKAVLKTSKNIETIISTEFKELPTVKKVLSRIKGANETPASHEYQGSSLTNYEQGFKFLVNHKNEYAQSVMSSLRDRIKIQHVDLLTDTVTLLATHGWAKSGTSDFADESVDRLSTRFSIPLEKAGVHRTLLQEEFHGMQ